jgi:hypothetical protein
MGDYLNPTQGSNTPAALSGLEREKVVPIVGIELTTYRLQGGCSTN